MSLGAELSHWGRNCLSWRAGIVSHWCSKARAMLHRQSQLRSQSIASAMFLWLKPLKSDGLGLLSGIANSWLFRPLISSAPSSGGQQLGNLNGLFPYEMTFRSQHPDLIQARLYLQRACRESRGCRQHKNPLLARNAVSTSLAQKVEKPSGAIALTHICQCNAVYSLVCV